MKHKTEIFVGGRPGTYDWTCTCGAMGLGYNTEAKAGFYAQSHCEVGNRHNPETCRHCRVVRAYYETLKNPTHDVETTP